MKRHFASLLILLAGVSATAAKGPNILDLKESITDNAIVYPESFETDTHKMMQNWYLQNYAVLDNNYADRPAVDATDQTYIDRLSAMPTEIEMPYNQIVRSYINMYTQRRRELVESMLGMSLYYMPIFEQALERRGLPLELRYLPVIESALNPDAVSRAGATGLWQFMIPTAKGLGLEINTLVDERRDPVASSEAAAAYLKQLYDMYGDWSLAIAAYNCGPGNVNKAIRRAGGGKKDFWSIYYYLPQETRGYVPAFIAANYVMTYYNQHNISPALARRPLITDSIHIDKRVHFKQISDVLNIPVEEIRVLNPQYRRDIIPGDSRPYSLVLPSMQVYSYIMSEDSILSHDASVYGRRTTVEPTLDSDGTTTRLVVKRHKVRRGETLSSIAKKYGVTVSDLKKWNGISRKTKSIARGRTLKINTYERVAAPKPQEETTSAPADTAARPMQTQQPDNAFDTGNTDTNDDIAARELEPQPEPEPTVVTSHTVRKGETLGKIASRYGVTVKQLQQANGISGSDIRVGQRLTIPAPGSEVKASGSSRKSQAAKSTPRTHKVAKGETLGKIASRYGVTVKQLQKANGIKGTNIKIGQKLKIPAA